MHHNTCQIIVVKSKANILIYYIAKINTTNKVTKNGYIVSTIGYDFYQRVRFCRVSYGPLPFPISLSNDAFFP